MPNSTDGKRPAALLGVVLVALLVAACGPQHLRTTAIFSETLGGAALAAQQAVTKLHDQGDLSETDYQAWQVGFLKLGYGIKALNQALRESNEQAVLDQVAALLKLTEDLVTLQIPRLKADQQMLVLVSLEAARTVLLTISAQWGAP